jgi:hypothetical protein
VGVGSSGNLGVELVARLRDLRIAANGIEAKGGTIGGGLDLS